MWSGQASPPKQLYIWRGRWAQWCQLLRGRLAGSRASWAFLSAASAESNRSNTPMRTQLAARLPSPCPAPPQSLFLRGAGLRGPATCDLVGDRAHGSRCGLKV